MKKLTSIIFLFACAGVQLGLGQSSQVLLPFQATGYEYSFVKSSDNNCSIFWKLNTAGTGWATGSLGRTGNAAFGTINNTSSPPCPLNTSTVVKTTWPSSRDLLLRKRIQLPYGARNVVIQLALDNDARIYFNGVALTGSSPISSNGCATLDNPALRFTVPDGLIRKGDNFLAIRGGWRSSKSFLDVKVTGQVSFTVTTTIVGSGSVTPPSPTEVASGSAYSATYAAAAGYRIGSITRNGVSATPETTRVSPESYTLTIPSVASAQQIVVTFVPKRFQITGVGGANGSVTPAVEYVLNGGASSGFFATANTGYHVETITSDPPLTSLFSATQPTTGPVTWPGPGGPYVITNVTNDMTLTASFGINYYSLTYTAGPNGTIEFLSSSTSPLPGTASYEHGTTITLKAVAADGYYFTGWTGVEASAEKVNPLTVTMTTEKTLAASFSPLPALVTIPITSLADSGPGSLRDALVQANGAAGPASIVFDPALTGVIELASPLPLLADVTTIIGGTDANGQPRVTVLRPSSGFAPDPALPDGFQMSGVFLPFGYVPNGSRISNLRITGFPGAGIAIAGNNNVVQGCVITGNAGDGISIIDGSNNLIGGTLPAEANAIYRNGGNGVTVKKSEAASVYPTGNGVLGNSIYENGKLGIDLGGAGVTLNRYPSLPPATDPRPIPTRANFGQAYPDLRFASIAGINPAVEPSIITGKLYGWPGGKFRVEIYLDDLGDASGNGEAKRLIAVKALDDPDPVQTNTDGTADFEIVSTVPLRGGEIITATATDDSNNTSEFSPNIYAGTITRIFGATDVATAEQGRYVLNTTFSGIPLHWSDGKGAYTVDPSVPSNS